LTENAGIGETGHSLEVLHEQISLCRVCESQVDNFQKPSKLDRGEAGQIIIVGQGPGSAELKGTRAFAGQAGRRLDSWLLECGASPEDPRGGIYFTSVIKCVGSDQQFSLMAANCAVFFATTDIGDSPCAGHYLGEKILRCPQGNRGGL